MTLGEKVKRLLKERGQPRRWLAENAGLSTPTVQNIVSGQHGTSYRHAMRIARVLDEDANWLLDDEKGWEDRTFRREETRPGAAGVVVD